MIYAIHAIGTSFVKFGVTKNLSKRLDAHQVSCPFQLEVVATAPWSNDAEGKIHNLLRQLWVRGEWFQYTSTAKVIIELMLANADERALDTIPSNSSDFIRKRMDRVTTHALSMRVANE